MAKQEDRVLMSGSGPYFFDPAMLVGAEGVQAAGLVSVFGVIIRNSGKCFGYHLKR